MPQAIPAALSIGGSLLSGLAGSGKQQQVNQNTSNLTTTNQNTTQNQNTSSFQQALESPYFSQFRQSLVPAFANEYAKAQQPIFGQAQQAQFMSQLNGLAKGATDSLTSSLARFGRLNSGALASGVGDIERQRLGQASQYAAMIPYQNEMARRQATQNLLGLGMNWAGRDPLSYQNTGSMSGQSSMTGTQTSTGQNQSTQSGPSWWQGALNGLGGAMGGIGGEMLSNQINGGNNGGGTPSGFTPYSQGTPFNPMPAPPSIQSPVNLSPPSWLSWWNPNSGY